MLTSLAVIGALILQMWEEALIVTILVAFTIHLEGDALLKARDAMQGGLDRLPRTARKLHDHLDIDVGNMAAISVAPTSSAPLLAAGLGLNMTTQEGPKSAVVPVDLIKPGDKVEVRSGELIPVDGRIVEGFGALNKAPLTGEAVPVSVGVGDTLSLIHI